MSDAGWHIKSNYAIVQNWGTWVSCEPIRKCAMACMCAGFGAVSRSHLPDTIVYRAANQSDTWECTFHWFIDLSVLLVSRQVSLDPWYQVYASRYRAHFICIRLINLANIKLIYLKVQRGVNKCTWRIEPVLHDPLFEVHGIGTWSIVGIDLLLEYLMYGLWMHCSVRAVCC